MGTWRLNELWRPSKQANQMLDGVRFVLCVMLTLVSSLMNIVNPIFPVSTPTFNCTLQDGLTVGEGCHISKPYQLPSLDGWKKRFLWVHWRLDPAVYIWYPSIIIADSYDHRLPCRRSWDWVPVVGIVFLSTADYPHCLVSRRGLQEIGLSIAQMSKS